MAKPVECLGVLLGCKKIAGAEPEESWPQRYIFGHRLICLNGLDFFDKEVLLIPVASRFPHELSLLISKLPLISILVEV